MTDKTINKSVNIRPFWVIFLKDQGTGFLNGYIYGHNPISGYRHRKNFVGMKRIEIDMESLEK